MRWSVLVIWLLSTSGVVAQKEPTAIITAGSDTCAQFSRGYQIDPKEVGTLYFLWAQGFMSGMNVMQSRRKLPVRNLLGIPIEDQQRMIREACNQKPLATMADVVHDLYQSLPSIPPQSK
jgi:hypothetical protein